MTTTSTSITRVALLACAGLAAVTVSASSASADDSHAAPNGGRKPDRCVTVVEYDKVEAGQTRASVRRSFDTSGHRTSITHRGRRTDEVRTYDVCHSPDSTVTVSYRKVAHGPFKVVSKTAVFVG